MKTHPTIEPINLFGTQGRIQSNHLSLETKRLGPFDEREDQTPRRPVAPMFGRDIENVVRRDFHRGEDVPRYEPIEPPYYIRTILGYDATEFIGVGKDDLGVCPERIFVYRRIPDQAFQPHPFPEFDQLR